MQDHPVTPFPIDLDKLHPFDLAAHLRIVDALRPDNFARRIVSDLVDERNQLRLMAGMMCDAMKHADDLEAVHTFAADFAANVEALPVAPGPFDVAEAYRRRQLQKFIDRHEREKREREEAERRERVEKAKAELAAIEARERRTAELRALIERDGFVMAEK